MQFTIRLAITIRPLEEGDLDGLEWDSERAIQAEYVRSVVRERGEQVVFLLALANDRPVGRLGIDFHRKSSSGIVHLWAFSVLPALQRLGIGTRLMREAESLIASRAPRATSIEVGVDDWNHDARRLYERLGYRHVGAERGSDGGTILLLRRPLG